MGVFSCFTQLSGTYRHFANSTHMPVAEENHTPNLLYCNLIFLVSEGIIPLDYLGWVMGLTEL